MAKFEDLIAVYQGPERGLEEIRGIADRDRLAAYPFYHTVLGEFELRSGQHGIAHGHFRAAVALARNPMERRFFDQRASACEQSVTQQANKNDFGTGLLSYLVWKPPENRPPRRNMHEDPSCTS